MVRADQVGKLLPAGLSGLGGKPAVLPSPGFENRTGHGGDCLAQLDRRTVEGTIRRALQREDSNDAVSVVHGHGANAAKIMFAG